MYRVTTSQKTMTMTSTKLSDDAFETVTDSISFTFSMPSNTYVSGLSMTYEADVDGEIFRCTSNDERTWVPLSKGSATVQMNVPSYQFKGRTIKVKFQWRPIFPTSTTIKYRKLNISASLNIAFDYSLSFPKNPSVFRLLRRYSAGEPVTLEWMGADHGRENKITSYVVEESLDRVNWSSVGIVETSDTFGHISVTPPMIMGQQKIFRIRTQGVNNTTDFIEVPETLMRGMEGVEEPIKLPRLLSRKLEVIETLHPYNVSLTENIAPLSTGSMDLPISQDISPRQFVEIFNAHGQAGIYQVSSVTKNYDTETCHAELEHGIVTLADTIVFEKSEKDTGSISGSTNDVVGGLLLYQTSRVDDMPYWMVGRVDAPESLEVFYAFSNENLLTAIQDTVAMLGTDYMFNFDQTSFPWKINVLRAFDKVSQCRNLRNLTSCQFTVDASGMFTRIYGQGYKDDKLNITMTKATMDGKPYIEADTVETYGVIENSFEETAITKVGMLKTVAEIYLEQHKEPSVQVDLSAIDLSGDTNEPADSFVIGSKCRVPLVEFNSFVENKIVSMQWDDLLGDPDNVKLTLSNKASESDDEIADIIRRTYASNALGTHMQTKTDHSSYLVYANDIHALTFTIESHAELLSVYAEISGTQNDFHYVSVDGKQVLKGISNKNTIDILPHLKKDEVSGSIIGTHTVTVEMGNSPGGYYVNITVTQRFMDR